MAGLATHLLRIAGWRVVGVPPDIPRCVLVFFPHTSNWDFPLLLLARSALGIRASYLGKHTLFRAPYGWFFRWLGGIPVERGEPQHLVSAIAEEFRRRSRLWLAMAPEGTRAKTDHWKSGFYRIALAAQVPVLLTFIDAGRKECGLCGLVALSGDEEQDLAAIRACYAGKRGIYPELAGDIRFRTSEH
jgi:1-acyl-sn-glycerol-3-phosphate acyltransferase